MFPPLPSWSQAHPLIIHFPIVLLLLAPLFVIMAGSRRIWARDMMMVALILTAIGTGFAALATATGSAAEDNVPEASPAAQVLEQHEELAELARNLFFGVTAVMLVATVLAWRFHHRAPQSVLLAAAIVLVAVYIGPILVLANAAHEGGRLVHEFGVRGGVAAADPRGAPAGTVQRQRKDDDD